METCLVLFVLTKQGFAELLDFARGGEAALWVNQGVLEDSELVRLRTEGFNLTDFTYWYDSADESEIQDAVETIREHHPGEALYVERT